MSSQSPKLSEVMKEMAQRLLRHPDKVPSSEAAHVALMFANIAWNESVGMTAARDGYRKAWESIEAGNPQMWKEFKSNNVDAMIDELVEYKKTKFPDDQRRILVCGFVKDNGEEKVHVEWMAPVAPGVDSKWEMRLYGLVRTGNRREAIRFLRESRNLTRAQAEEIVALAATKVDPK
jgi:hypothetical protein